MEDDLCKCDHDTTYPITLIKLTWEKTKIKRMDWRKQSLNHSDFQQARSTQKTNVREEGLSEGRESLNVTVRLKVWSILARRMSRIECQSKMWINHKAKKRSAYFPSLWGNRGITRQLTFLQFIEKCWKRNQRIWGTWKIKNRQMTPNKDLSCQTNISYSLCQGNRSCDLEGES